MTAILSIASRTHDTPHQQCEQCSYPPYRECCALCTSRAAFLAHVVSPFDPEPVALARVVYVPRDIRDARGLVAIAAVAA